MSAMRPGPQPEKWNESVYTNGKQMLSCDGGASLKYADQVPRRSQWTLLHGDPQTVDELVRDRRSTGMA